MLNTIQREEIGESFSYFSDSESPSSNSNASWGSSSKSTDHSSSWWSSSAPKKEEVGESFSYEEPVEKEEVGESFSYEEPSQKQEDTTHFSSSSSSNYKKPRTYTHIPSHTHSTHYVYSHNTAPQYSTSNYPYYRAEPRPITLGGVIFAGALFCLGVFAISMIFSRKSNPLPSGGGSYPSPSTPPSPRTGYSPPPPPVQHIVDTFKKPVERECQIIRDTLLQCPNTRRIIHGVTEIFGKVCKMFKYPAHGSTPCQVKEEDCRCDWRAVKA